MKNPRNDYNNTYGGSGENSTKKTKLGSNTTYQSPWIGSSSSKSTTQPTTPHQVPVDNNNQKDRLVLSLVEYFNWKPQQVSSVLCSEGGLTVDKVLPLFDIAFDGSNLDSIVKDIKNKGEDGAVGQMVNNKDFAKVSQSTCKQVVNWVSNHLMAPPKQTQTLSAQQLSQILQLHKGLRGAGLSRNQGESLINAKFDGKKLEEIALVMQTEGEIIALEQLKVMTTELVDETCKAIVEWLGKNYPLICVTVPNSFIDKTTMITPEYIKEARNDPQYEFLRNLHNNQIKWEKLEKMIGKNIPLPKLGETGSNHVPKDYNPDIPYLLTRQRYEVLKKVIERNEEGFVFSGPHGVSKSYTMCLLAAYAIVNSIPLLYVPRCLDWVTNYNTGGQAMANDYLRSLVFLWNSDILSEDDIKELKSSVNVVSYMSKNVATQKSVFYLFDEHNELFKADLNGRLYSTHPYFTNYTRWTGVTSGDKTMTIYCGSAHSSFEDHLPGGATSKLIRIVPPTETEFKTLIEDFGLSISDYKIIHYATGRIPRELKLLVESNEENISFNEKVVRFMNGRQSAYELKLESLFESQSENRKKNFLNTLEGIFTLGIGEGRPFLISGTFYDQGLLYKDQSDRLYTINETAKRVLFNHYCTNSPPPIIPSNISGVEKGCLFERYLIRQEFSKTHKDRLYYIINEKNSNLSTLLSYTINIAL